MLCGRAGVLTFVLLCQPVAAVDFSTHYLQRTTSAQVEFSVLLRIYQAQLATLLTASYRYRYLLHSLLALPPLALPAVLQLPDGIALPVDEWGQRERLSVTDLLRAVLELAQQPVGNAARVADPALPAALLSQLLATRVRYRNSTATVRSHINALRQEYGSDSDDVRSAQTLQHFLVLAVVHVLRLHDEQLQQLQELARRLPTALQFGDAEQRRTVAVLRTLVSVSGELPRLDLDAAEQEALARLQRTQQRQQALWWTLASGGTLAAALLLWRGGMRLRGHSMRSLWSKRVLGMHFGYSVTTLAAFYPAWQLGRAVKRRVQRELQTPADLRGWSDYRIAYLAFLSNPRNLERQQETLLLLGRCLRRLQPLFATQAISVVINTERNRYHHTTTKGQLTIAVPYSVSSSVAVAATLAKIISHYHDWEWPHYLLPEDTRTYCRRDKV